ncbi:XRE family transcriptional regulator [Methylotenera sp.]|uniref:helix-turn-helix domain-containing protein n=1 Tax=Methylotenera sp. TaxID=2051956 RepID=UPI0025EF1825|nr:XRE family transcriptional regulator [Methylotenera sp.]
MTIQISTYSGIPEGFGQRLRDERKRLRLTQQSLAEIAGCQKLAQLQYESDISVPNIRYLNAIAIAGVDLGYLILGIRFAGASLSQEQSQRVEDKVFELIDKCAKSQPDGKFSPDSHKMLFKLFRGYLTQVELGQLPSDFDPLALIANQFGATG